MSKLCRANNDRHSVFFQSPVPNVVKLDGYIDSSIVHFSWNVNYIEKLISNLPMNCGICV